MARTARAALFAIAAASRVDPVAPLDPGLSEAFRVGDANGDAALDANEFESAVASLFRIGAASGAVKAPPAAGGSGEPAAPSKFAAAFVNSMGMIWATEIGDKTFFIAAILAMKHARLVIFLGAVSALAVMTVLSAAMGYALPALMPRTYTHYASALLFFYFGCRMLKDASSMSGSGVSEELGEVEEELGGAGHGKKDVEDDGAEAPPPAEETDAVKVLGQAFMLTFLAEWGDRSQIATIALASAKDPYGVTAGGIVGHSMCTGLAVVGGRMLASRISEKHVHVVGGLIFLVFAAYSFFFEDVHDE
jgi:putative Ca2+/H+ antiporter (TMEM165/GDT1 family)